MKFLGILRTVALLAFLGSFAGPSVAYGACEESIVCESHGGGCYQESYDENGDGCFAHSCSDGYCSSGCTFGGVEGPGPCGQV